MSETSVKTQILNLHSSSKLAHAILLDGGGSAAFKSQLANEIAREILQITAEFVPDLMVVEKDEGKKEINVAKAREIGEFLNQTAVGAVGKVVIIDSACELNRSAANAILKILEEPQQNNFFILISNNISRILSTIRSRCQIFRIPSVSFAQFAEKLSESSPNLTSEQIKILAQICDNSIEDAVNYGDELIGLYEDFLNSFLNQKIDNDFLSKISAKNFDFRRIEAVFQFFCNRLLKSSQGANFEKILCENEVFAILTSRFSLEEIFSKCEESTSAIRKATTMSLNKSLSFINVFNKYS